MHEHFASELLRGFLAVQLNALNQMASGPRVVCATLPGEQHSLGLQMASVLLAAANFRVLFLGANTPPDQIARAAGHVDVAAVLIGSSSAAERSELQDHVRALRGLLPGSVEMAVGGSAVRVPGVAHLDTLEESAAWGDTLVATLTQVTTPAQMW
jgi:methylmalonyl-CoA mutase cobalamin-binding subunit